MVGDSISNIGVITMYGYVYEMTTCSPMVIRLRRIVTNLSFHDTKTTIHNGSICGNRNILSMMSEACSFRALTIVYERRFIHHIPGTACVFWTPTQPNHTESFFKVLRMSGFCLDIEAFGSCCLVF